MFEVHDALSLEIKASRATKAEADTFAETLGGAKKGYIVAEVIEPIQPVKLIPVIKPIIKEEYRPAPGELF